jgi:two-component system, OmpR family, sensor histidine kinase VanS
VRLSIRGRLTLIVVGLIVAMASALLAVSWWLLSGHLDRTLAPAAADEVMDTLALQYVVATAGAALVALGLAWLAAGHALAPIRRIAATARRVREDRLDARVRHTGPEDELHDLATSFDAMLDRVEASVAAQRRFVANASHELRTPLTIMRTEAEVALDDPGVTPAQLREVAHAVIETTDRTERLIDALLVLATSTEGARRDDPVDLAAVARRAARGPVSVDLDAVRVRGDEALLERLVGNLVENAVRYGSDVRVGLDRRGDEARLVVRNAGEPIPDTALAQLTQPFQRLDRTRGRGSGLGLSIVDAVAQAHGGSLRLAAPPAGGLTAEVRLPAVPR